MEIRLNAELSNTHFSGKDIRGEGEVDKDFFGISLMIFCMIEKGRMASRNEKK